MATGAVICAKGGRSPDGVCGSDAAAGVENRVLKIGDMLRRRTSTFVNNVLARRKLSKDIGARTFRWRNAIAHRQD